MRAVEFLVYDSAHQFRNGDAFVFGHLLQSRFLWFAEVDVRPIQGHGVLSTSVGLKRQASSWAALAGIRTDGVRMRPIRKSLIRPESRAFPQSTGKIHYNG